MKLLLTSLAASACIGSIGQAQIFSDNFNSQTPGNTVSGWTAVTPSAATALRGAVITNEAAGNNALRMYDTDGANSARVEQDFTSRADVHLSLNFHRNVDIAVDPSANSTTAFYVTVGANGLSQGTQANRDMEFRLFSNGAYRINRGVQNPDGTFASTSLTTT